MAEPQAVPGGGGEPAAKDKEAYERVVVAGAMVLYSEATHAQVMRMLAQGEPAQALVNVVAMTLSQLDQRAGGKIPRHVIAPAALELLALAAELAQAAGIEVTNETVSRAAQMLTAVLARSFGAGTPPDSGPPRLRGDGQAAAPQAPQGAMPPTPGAPGAMAGGVAPSVRQNPMPVQGLMGARP